MAARAELLLGHGISAASGKTKQMLFDTHLRIFTDFKVKNGKDEVMSVMGLDHNPILNPSPQINRV